ncbi:ABZJ_00895 family protein [uncultured Roseovarius sp.]|uniref:ABZJ_00895 family protein n=1 Tax=uncultured Roseovarius sp. TaxID=293344 RepID=UPI0026365B71|nr:ABZJ_00895 family protein [uncultured Roseovarius sp.]
MSYSVKWSRFVMRYALILIGISLLLYLAGKFFNFNLRSSGATVVPIILVTMLEGVDFAKAQGETPKGSWAWQQSALFGFVGLGITMAFAAFFMSAFPGGLGQFLTPVGFAALSTITVIMAVFFVVGARLFFWMGARNELKRQSRG